MILRIHKKLNNIKINTVIFQNLHTIGKRTYYTTRLKVSMSNILFSYKFLKNQFIQIVQCLGRHSFDRLFAHKTIRIYKTFSGWASKNYYILCKKIVFTLDNFFIANVCLNMTLYDSYKKNKKK